MAGELYYNDFNEYSAIFNKHAGYIAELMSMFNHQLYTQGLNPVENSSELFRIVLDVLFCSDLTYRTEKNAPDKYDLITFPYSSKDEMLNSMRSLLKEELDRYLGHSDATNQ